MGAYRSVVRAFGMTGWFALALIVAVVIATAVIFAS